MFRASIGALLALLLPAMCSAQQIIESAGSRALGMGGAFVAVADDATAAYWNPAGLATGPLAGMTIEWADFRTGDQKGPPVAGPTHRTSKLVSLGTLPIGLSYGTFQDSALAVAPSGETRAETFAVSQFGATFLQTVATGLVIGSTVKYERGRVISGPIEGLSASDALGHAAQLDGPSSGHLDVDVGAMADFGKARLGVTVRNLREPTFSDAAGNAITLHRQSRMGLAVMPVTGLTLAVDLDLDKAELWDGPRRMLAFGGEDRIGHRWTLRAGVRWNLEGTRRPIGAVGASLSIRRNFWLDGHYTQGSLDVDRGFGVAMRAGF